MDNLLDHLKLVNVDYTVGLFKIDNFVRKKSGSIWRGKVVGFYSTKLTPTGYCVESIYEPGSVQLYPEAALELAELVITAIIDPREVIE